MTDSTAHAISPDSGALWTEPGAWPVAPGVHRIPLPLPMDGLRAVNVYAIETPDGLTLIDAGWAIEVSRELLESSLRAAGYGLGDIRRCLVTHVHRDHYTQAVAVRREVSTEVVLGIGDKPTLDLVQTRQPGDEEPMLVHLRSAGAPELARSWGDFTTHQTPDLTLWEHPDTWLTEDVSIDLGTRSLDAIATPGHTQGHYVYADPAAGLLFAGDHVLPTITPSIGFEPAVAELPLGDFLGSLAKVRALPDRRLLPAHGPVAASAHARIDELLAHHAHRLDLCAQALTPGGAATAHEVAVGLPWTRHDRAFGELDLFSSALATLETRAHLDLLAVQGRAVRTVAEDGLVVYAAPGP